jgi:hypothetical protein
MAVQEGGNRSTMDLNPGSANRFPGINAILVNKAVLFKEIQRINTKKQAQGMVNVYKLSEKTFEIDIGEFGTLETFSQCLGPSRLNAVPTQI